MASFVEISAQLGAEVGSAYSVSQNTQKLRAAARSQQVFVYIAENFDSLKREVDVIKKALRRAPTVGRIQIAGADILDLVVGGEDGPGQLLVLSGPPSYARVGFVGTEDSGTTVNLTSAVGGTFTTATPHGLLQGDIFKVVGNTSVNHLGWHEVATTPTPTTLTVVTAPAGSGTGGTLERVIAGAWFRSVYLGGTSFEDSPLYSTPQGQLRIGKNGSVSLRDSFDVEKGYIGVTTPEATKAVSGTADNGSGVVRLTVTAHGYESGDTVLAGSAGYAVTVIDANTIDLIGSVFGTFTPVATVARYFAGIWDEQHASGGTGYADAPFRVKADGSVRIGDLGTPHFEVSADGDVLIGEATGPRVEIDGATGDFSIIDADILIASTGGSTIKINTTDGFEISTAGEKISIDPTGLFRTEVIGVAGREGIYGYDNWSIQYENAKAQISALVGVTGSQLSLENSAGVTKFSLDTSRGDIQAPAYAVGVDVVIDASRNGAFNAVAFDDPATTRTNLDVYSKTETNDEIDARIALALGGASFVTTATFNTHTHAYSGSTGVTSGHQHSYSGSTGTP